MAASVRIEDEAFVDPRVELLGSIAGYNRFEALGRLAHLWRVCTQRDLYVLPEFIVAACLGEKGPDALLKSGLGEQDAEGMYRIKGTAGRIEWLRLRREASRAGGAANKSRMAAEAQVKASRRKPRGSQKLAEGSQEVAKLSQVASHLASQVEPTGSPLVPTPTASPTHINPQTPEPGGEIRESGPNPRAVVEFWNAQKKLLPAKSEDLHRDSKIRFWALDNRDWIQHWKAVIEFMGRTPLYCGEETRWKCPLSWLFKEGKFAAVCDAMLGARPKPRQPSGPNIDCQRQPPAHYGKPPEAAT